MTETPPADPGTETPPADPPTDGSGTEAVTPESGELAAPTGGSSNLTITEVMKAATLPTPAGGSGGPITTVYGTKAPPVWTTKGWAKDATGKPNIGAGETKVVVQTEKMTNATLNNAKATIVKSPKAEDTWETKGWTVDSSGGGGTAITGVTAGSPGSFTPSGATKPANLAALKADTVVGDAGSAKPGAAWTTGQSVKLADASDAHWDGTAWQSGVAA